MVNRPGAILVQYRDPFAKSAASGSDSVTAHDPLIYTIAGITGGAMLGLPAALARSIRWRRFGASDRLLLTSCHSRRDTLSR